VALSLSLYIGGNSLSSCRRRLAPPGEWRRGNRQSPALFARWRRDGGRTQYPLMQGAAATIPACVSRWRHVDAASVIICHPDTHALAPRRRYAVAHLFIYAHPPCASPICGVSGRPPGYTWWQYVWTQRRPILVHKMTLRNAGMVPITVPKANSPARKVRSSLGLCRHHTLLTFTRWRDHVPLTIRPDS